MLYIYNIIISPCIAVLGHDCTFIFPRTKNKSPCFGAKKIRQPSALGGSRPRNRMPRGRPAMTKLRAKPLQREAWGRITGVCLQMGYTPSGITLSHVQVNFLSSGICLLSTRNLWGSNWKSERILLTFKVDNKDLTGYEEEGAPEFDRCQLVCKRISKNWWILLDLHDGTTIFVVYVFFVAISCRSFFPHFFQHFLTPPEEHRFCFRTIPRGAKVL